MEKQLDELKNMLESFILQLFTKDSVRSPPPPPALIYLFLGVFCS